MTLVVATSVQGDARIENGDPVLEDHDDVVYVPLLSMEGYGWGLFNTSGHLIDAAAFRQGPHRDLTMQVPHVANDRFAAAAWAPEPNYIYIGPFMPHYGHFLLSSLSRWWPLGAFDKPNVKFLYHAGGLPSDWFDLEHVRFVLAGLGLSPNDFVRFDSVTRLRHVQIARPAFVETSTAYAGFANLCNRIGELQRPTVDRPKNRRAVYLSKRRLASGNWRISNEDALEAALQTAGVEIVYPEQLDFAEQVHLFRERPLVLSTVNSALHTTIFALDTCPIVALGFTETVASNFTMIDKINGNRVLYLYDDDNGLEPVPNDSGFNYTVRLRNPERTAEELLGHARNFCPGVLELNMSSHANSDESLDAIGSRFGTDKASFHHNFLAFYERFFAEIRHKPNLRMLEIGIWDGASLRTWEEYFPHATITGVDINPDTLKYASHRVSIEIGDQSNVLFLADLIAKHGPFDIVVDDGSHVWNHQITSFRTLFPFVKPGGFYVMEDLDTSYGTFIPSFKGIGGETMASYLHRLNDYMVGDKVLDIAQEPDEFIRSFAHMTELMAYYRRTCVIRRKP